MSRGGALVAAFLLYLLLLALIVFAGAFERSGRHAPPRAVQADWPRCFTQQGPPLLQQPLPEIDRDPHRPRDGGLA